MRQNRINDVLRYILQIDKELDENKKGQISKNMSLSRVVESPRIELGSKQAIKELSTCLVFNWFSICYRLKTAYSRLSFLVLIMRQSTALL